MINRSVCTFFTDIDRCFMPSLIFMYCFLKNFTFFSIMKIKRNLGIINFN